MVAIISYCRKDSCTLLEGLKVFALIAPLLFFSVLLTLSLSLSLELIITSGGKNIAPAPMENAIKEALPFLSNVMLVGDKRNYITCLVTLKGL